MSNQFLKQVEGIIDQAGYSVVYHDQTQNTPFEYLSVTLPFDTKKRAREIIIKTEEVDFTIPIEGKSENRETLIQMISYLPFDVSEESTWEVLRMVNFFNSALATPGFFLDEGRSRVCFRNSFFTSDCKIKDDTLLSLVKLVQTWIDAASDAIEQTASGRSMAEVVNSSFTT